MTPRKRPPRTSTGALAGGPMRAAEQERADVVAWLRRLGDGEDVPQAERDAARTAAWAAAWASDVQQQIADLVQLLKETR